VLHTLGPKLGFKLELAFKSLPKDYFEIKLKFITARKVIDNIASMHFWLTEIAVYKTNDTRKKRLDWAKQELKKSMRKINRNLLVMRKVYPEIKWQNH
jgi:hypothetical protein